MVPKNWRAEASTMEQRQEISRRSEEGRLRWGGVLQIASKLTGRTITTIGQLTRGECSDLIDELGDE